MPVTKNKLLRLQTILSMMRKNSYPNFTSFMLEMRGKDIAGAFKLSRKTFSRDIEDLKNDFNAPIKYSATEKGFYLTNNEWYSEELMIEPFEMKAALLGERVASSIFAEPLKSEIKSAVDSLLMKNESGLAEKAQLDSLKIIRNEFAPTINVSIFKSVYDAWEQRKTIEITYTSLRGKLSKKIFEPYIFAWCGGSWYLKGKLLKENGEFLDPPKIQVLALHRIQEILVYNREFYPEQALIKSLENNSLFDFDKIPEVIIEYPLPKCSGVKEIYDNQENVIIKEDETKVTIHFKDISEYMVMNIFWRELGEAKILYPDSLRQKILDISNKVIEKHIIVK